MSQLQDALDDYLAIRRQLAKRDGKRAGAKKR